MDQPKTENAPPALPEARVADTIGAAAGMTGRSESFLQAVKDRGCPAFRGSRVYVDELEAYLDTNDLSALEEKYETLDALSVEIQREKLAKIQFENAAARGKYIERAQIAGKLTDIGHELKSVLLRKLEQELPGRLEGKTAEAIRPIMRALADELCTIFAKGTKEWNHAA